LFSGAISWLYFAGRARSAGWSRCRGACLVGPDSCFGGTAISTNFRYNEQIRISPIFLIDDKDEKIGSTSTSEALKMAREAGLDLVEVAPTARPPVCKIMDYGKWRYQQQKKEDKSRASARGGQLKELKLKTVKIGEHDLMIKINHAKEFLKEGNKVQFTLQFKGREMAHLELGRDIFTKIKSELWPFSKIERDSKMEGRRMTLVLQPDHKQPGAKQPTGPAGKAPAFSAGAGMNIPARPPVAASATGAAPAPTVAAAPAAPPPASPVGPSPAAATPASAAPAIAAPSAAPASSQPVRRGASAKAATASAPKPAVQSVSQ
jgi:translation initiation factor IF-3